LIAIFTKKSDKIKEEMTLIESEKKTFEENLNGNIEKQKEKLQEILVRAKKSREQLIIEN
jgi:DNA polymerase III delta prime subunit